MIACVKKLFKMVPRTAFSYGLIISLIIAINCEQPPDDGDIPSEYSEPSQSHNDGYNSDRDDNSIEHSYSKNYPTGRGLLI